MEKNYFIYGLRLKSTTEFRYVGYTYKEINKRLTEHYDEKQNKDKTEWLSQNKGNVETIQIETFISDIPYAHKQEIYWIKFYKDSGHRLLNKTNGGEGTNGYKHSKESIQKTINHPNHPKNNPLAVQKIISHPNHSKNNKEVIKKIISHPNHPANHPEMMEALHRHPNSCENNPVTMQKILNHPNHPKNNHNATLKMLAHPNIAARNKKLSKAVVQLDLNGKVIQMFRSLSDAAKFLGDINHHSSISDAASGVHSTAFGFKWCFYNSNIDLHIVLTEKINKSIKKGQKIPSGRNRAIAQCDLNDVPIRTFISTAEAMRVLEIGSVGNCLSGREKTAYGFKWKYQEQ